MLLDELREEKLYKKEKEARKKAREAEKERIKKEKEAQEAKEASTEATADKPSDEPVSTFDVKIEVASEPTESISHDDKKPAEEKS